MMRAQQGQRGPSGQSRASRYFRAVSASGINAKSSNVEMVDLLIIPNLCSNGNRGIACSAKPNATEINRFIAQRIAAVGALPIV